MPPKPITSPLSGFRDFLPADVRRREHVLAKVREVYARYGFEPLETPTLERLDNLLGKYGDEGDKLLFRVLHRGDSLKKIVAAGEVTEAKLSDEGLRYDLTVPLARVVAEYQAQLPKFFKRYQIQPVWRADRPGRGRFREFYQCDVDIVGSAELVCEVEVASAICEVLDGLGFTDYKIRLNHRGLLRGLIESAGVPLDLEVTAITALDKLDKVGVEGVEKELAGRGVTPEAAKLLLQRALLAGATPGSNPALLAALAPLLATSEAGTKAIAELTTLLGYAAGTPAASKLTVDPSLARGLSYYTGPIFEIQVSDLQGSLGGGGRYNDLIGMFLGKPVPAVGFSLGLERILVVMEERKMFPPLEAPAQVMVLRLDEKSTAESLRLASELRRAGIATELYPNTDKLGKQLQYAEQRRVRVSVFAGEKEHAAGKVALKVMATQTQSEVAVADLVAEVKKLLGG
jgi:histidyl-tRNA synthetase